MENEEFMEVETVFIPMEDGSEMECAILDQFELDGKQYMIVASVDNDELSDEDYVYSYTEDEDGLLISSIDDDEEFQRVADYYDQLCQEEEEEGNA